MTGIARTIISSPAIIEIRLIVPSVLTSVCDHAQIPCVPDTINPSFHAVAGESGDV
jgi:hypothetical protein